MGTDLAPLLFAGACAIDLAWLLLALMTLRARRRAGHPSAPRSFPLWSGLAVLFTAFQIAWAFAVILRPGSWFLGPLALDLANLLWHVALAPLSILLMAGAWLFRILKARRAARSAPASPSSPASPLVENQPSNG